MNQPYDDYIRLGIVHFMAYPECMAGEGPVVDTARALLDAGFEVLEMTHVANPAARRALRTLADERGAELSYGAQPILLGRGLDLNHEDDAERLKALRAVEEAIDEAAELGSGAVAVLSGKVAPNKAAARERLIDSLRQLAAFGKTRGVRLVLETFDQQPYAKNALIGPTADAVAVSEALREDFDDFGLLLDLSHLPLLGESSADALRTAGDHLVHAHIGNCAMDDPGHPAYGDQHPRFAAAGTRNGTAELADFLRQLFAAGYLREGERRVVSFEVKPMPGEEPEELVAHSKAVFEEAWERV
jgi:sugar phosphate isomerase/epimerase